VTQSFIRTTLFVTGGLLIWAADFIFTYVVAAVACARGFTGWSVLGMNAVRVTIVLATVIAATLTGGLAWTARRMHRRALDARQNGSSEVFLAFMALAVSGLALIAILWNGFASFLRPHCPT
jgi:hypothetical protein